MLHISDENSVFDCLLLRGQSSSGWNLKQQVSERKRTEINQDTKTTQQQM